jgi:hypothetical protein
MGLLEWVSTLIRANINRIRVACATAFEGLVSEGYLKGDSSWDS